MKVNNSFLSKIIKQEIKNVLYEEMDVEKRLNAANRIAQMRNAAQQDASTPVIRKLTKLFIDYRNQLMNDPTRNSELVVHFHKILKSIAPDLKPNELINYLDGKIDRQLLSFVSDLMKHDPNMPHGGYSLPSYEMPLELGREQGVMPYNRGQVDAFMRAPQHNGPYEDEEQIDDRHKKKNLVHENAIPPLQEVDGMPTREPLEPSGYYGIVTEHLYELSNEERAKFKSIQGYWLDPLITKQTTPFLRNGNFEGLKNKVGEIMKGIKSGDIVLDYSKVQAKLDKPAPTYVKNTIEQILWNPKNEAVLRKHGIVDVGMLGSGTDGIAFELQNGRVLKITTNKPEAEAANKVLNQFKGSAPKNIVQIFEVFYFTKAQVPQQQKEAIEDKTAPGKIPKSVAQQSNAPQPAAQQTSDESQTQLNNFIKIAQEFKLPDMMMQLSKLGIQFSDFHDGNIMKRKNGEYVINDLGRSAGGLAVQNPLAEKKEYLKQLILQVIKNS